MACHQVVGVFGSMARARLAREALIVEGFPEEHITLSMDMTEDGIAAEAPGESYENQPNDRGGAGDWFGSWRRDAADRRAAQAADAARRGVCVVTAEARNAAEADRAQEIMEALRPIDLTMPVI